VIAIEDHDTILGLAVEKIGDIVWLDIEQMKMPNQVPDTMAPFIRGECQMGENKDPLRLLDQIAVVRSARWGAA